VADDYKVQLSDKKGERMLNVRADTALEFKALYSELSSMPELSEFFRQAKSVVINPAGEEVSVERGGPIVVVPAPDTKLSALEIARQRMKGGQ